MQLREQCRRVALGLDPPSLLIRGGRVFSPFTGEFFPADVALCGPLIAGVGEYPGGAGTVIDAAGAYVLPGFIDAHVHPETSLLSPRRFAEALAVHGVTSALAEPHEIVNLLGAAGIEFYLQARLGLPLDLRLMIPTSVPASPFERAAGRLESADIEALLTREGVSGLGEAMDYLGLINGTASSLPLALAGHRVLDGHAPDISGRDLAAYLIAGPITDHETSDPELLLERRRLGMWILIREGSAARDLARSLPFLVEHGTERTALCTDDRNAAALAEHHHLDGMVGALHRAGVSLNDALRAATVNPATLYGLHDRGSVTPGLQADLLVVDDPCFPHPRRVVQAGNVTVQDGRLTARLPATPPLTSLPFRLDISDADDLAPEAADGLYRARAIQLVPRSIVSDERIVEIRARGGRLLADPDNDVALVALLERGRGTNEVGRGLLSGLGLRRGAIATTIAHDAHHLLVTGVHPRDMLTAARAVASAGGGLAVADGSTVHTLPLPLAGLMTDLPAAAVGVQLRLLETAAAALGVELEEPFMALSFITLSVIPRLRITLGGVLDVEAQSLVPLLVG
ncbi:MAG: adenine deaminase C-terminal domain-containing protein [bacterium]